MDQYQRYMCYISMILGIFCSRAMSTNNADQFYMEESCLYSSGILRITTARSSARCALLCHLREDCVAYGHDPVAQSCRLGRSFLPEPCSTAAPSIAGEFVYVSESRRTAYLLTLACHQHQNQVGARDDLIGQIQPQTETSWGLWGAEDMCPGGTYAHGFRLKIEEDQGFWDDTALNAIELQCRSPCDNADSEVTSTVRSTGDWTDMKTCASNRYLVGAKVKSEEEISGDNTAVNDYDFVCKSATSDEQTTLYGGGSPDGDWSDWESCPPGSYVCGLKTLVESDQGLGSDDTALNDAIFYCCRYH